MCNMKYPIKELVFVFTLLCILLLSSCDSQDVDIEESGQPSMTSFAFLKEYNKQLEKDVVVDVSQGDTIIAFIPFLNTDSLIASFDGNFIIAKVGDVEQISNVSRNNYNNPITYILYDRNGNISKLTLLITGYNGLPRVEISTEDGSLINSKQEYINAKVHIGNSPINGVLESSCRIKGRGHFTWLGYPKKPYHLRLNQKKSVLGFPSNKDWVLLADYTDKSLLRTAYLFGLSKAVEMDWTPKYQHVELYINNEYQGVYIFTEQVERAKERVNVEDDGFIIEDDNHWSEEPLCFQTNLLKSYYTFKYPKPIDKINIGDSKFEFISSFMNNLESELVKISTEKETHYYDYIDLESFAKWYIIMELMGNYEPNLYYTLASPDSVLKASPAWDAEWSLGLAAIDDRIERIWKKTPYIPQVNSFIWKDEKMYAYLLKDPVFVDVLVQQWDKYKSNILNVKKEIEVIRESLVNGQKSNFERWPVLGQLYSAILITFETWKEETEYCNSFFHERYNWFDNYVNSYKK